MALKLKKILEDIRDIPRQSQSRVAESKYKKGDAIPLDQFIDEFPLGDSISVSGDMSQVMANDQQKQDWYNNFVRIYGKEGEAVVWSDGPSTKSRWIVKGNEAFVKKAKETVANIARFLSEK